MAAPTEYYVDPAIAGASGAGTVGDPYGDLQHALDTVTRDSTNGDRFNIKAGTDEILSSALTLATYGTPTDAAPIIFQGYTSAAGDGGIGGISGNGSVAVYSTATNFMKWFDLHLHNCGSAVILTLGQSCTVFNCEINNSSGNLVATSTFCTIIFNYLHDGGAIGISLNASSIAAQNTLANGTKDFSTGIAGASGAGPLTIMNNTLSLDGSSDGISAAGDEARFIGNSVYSSSGTGQGILATNSARDNLIVLNNLVEGFSGVGGIGFQLVSGIDLYGNNAAYNNTTNYSVSSDVLYTLGTNETLSASPFVDAANGDFRVLTNVKQTAWPTANLPNLSVSSYLDKGAVQRLERLRKPRIRWHST